MLQKIVDFLRGHASSLSSYVVVLLTLIGTLMAAGVVAPDSTLAHTLGYVVSIATVLGFKALPVPAAAVPKSA